MAVAEASLVGVPLGVTILVLQSNAGHSLPWGTPAAPQTQRRSRARGEGGSETSCSSREANPHGLIRKKQVDLCLKQVPGQTGFPAPRKGNQAAQKGTDASALKHPSCSLPHAAQATACGTAEASGRRNLVFYINKIRARMDLGPITYQVVMLWQCLPAVVENAALCQSEFSFTDGISWTQIPAPQGGQKQPCPQLNQTAPSGSHSFLS